MIIKNQLPRFFTTTLFQSQAKVATTAQKRQKERIVVLGSGWAGHKFIKALDKTRYQVCLVSPKNYFTFTPLLASTSVGTLEFRSAIEPVRQSRDLQFFEAKCTDIRLDSNSVTCESSNKESFSLAFDRLVIACGAVPNTFNIPGVQEHAYFLKDVGHARQIRQRLLECFELASQPTVSNAEKRRLLHFAVVGGGPTGVEFSAELHDFIRQDVSQRYPHLMDFLNISLFDVAPHLLGSFDRSLSEYTETKFRERGIQVRTNTAVTQVTEEHLMLGDGSHVPYGLLVWSTGLAPTPLIKTLALPKDKQNRLFTDECLHVYDSFDSNQPEKNHVLSHIYAIGDCATIVNNNLPCTAQVAKQKGEYLAKRFNREIDLKTPPEPFEYRHRGSMAYIGENKAVVDFDNSKTKKGTIGWLIWRGAYMTMAESIRNKIKIPTYWALTWFLGRETSRF